MNTLSQTSAPEIKVLTVIKTNRMHRLYRNQDIKNALPYIWSQQDCLKSRFKQHIVEMIDSIEFAYPNDALKLKRTIGQFLQLSDTIRGEHKRRTSDQHRISGIEWETEKQSHAGYYSEVVILQDKDQWMHDWLEQVNLLSADSTHLSVTENIQDTFCFYDNTVSGN